jgi:hypothetical protein
MLGLEIFETRESLQVRDELSRMRTEKAVQDYREGKTLHEIEEEQGIDRLHYINTHPRYIRYHRRSEVEKRRQEVEKNMERRVSGSSSPQTIFHRGIAVVKRIF